MSGEKTEKATPKRRKDERKKGNIFLSKEVTTVASLLVTFYSLKILLPFSLTEIEKRMVSILKSMQYPEMSIKVVQNIFIDSLITFALAALPIILIGCLTAIIITIAQTRGLVSFQAIKPKFSKLNPISGIKNMFSANGIVELIKSILKIGIVIYISYTQFLKFLPQLPRLMDMSIIQSMAFVGDMILSIVQSVVIIFVFVAAADFGYQWWNYERKMRMSKQEVKEEYKQAEGDPQIKGKIRERQQAIARRRMMQEVPTADVVIRNPTHFAIAIRYKQGEDIAPIVVAKGADAIALRIVAIAQENKVFVTENKPLARGLYDAVELEQIIPTEFYQAIAEVLAIVFKARETEKNRGY